jgi:DNA-binding YbaB/EbfC family protein
VTSFPDGGEYGDVFARMRQLQETVADAEAAALAHPVEGSAAGGLVRVRASGEFSFDAVSIDPSVVDPADVSLLEDLVLAAVRDAAAQLTRVRSDALGGVLQSALGELLGGGALGELGGIFDEPDDEPDDETTA